MYFFFISQTILVRGKMRPNNNALRK